MALVIENKKLSDLDSDVRYYNLLFNHFYTDCIRARIHNPNLINKLVSDAVSLKKTAEAIDDGELNDFEKLVKKNIVESIQARWNYLDYYFFGNSVKTVDEFLVACYGYDIRTLENNLLNFDLQHDLNLHQMNALHIEYLIDAPYEEYIRFLKIIIPSFKEDIMNFCIDKGILPDIFKTKQNFPFDFEILLDKEQGAGWEEDVRILSINPDLFRIYRYRNKIAVNPGIAEDFLIHEVIHIAQGFFSSKLPLSLRQDIPQIKNISSIPVTEGIATYYTQRFMEERVVLMATSAGFEFNITESTESKPPMRVVLKKEEMEHIKSAIKFPQYRDLAENYYTYLTLRQCDDPAYDAHAAFMEVRNKLNTGSKTMKMLNDKVPIFPDVNSSEKYDFPYQLAYHVGYDYIMQLKNEITEKYGEPFFHEKRKMLYEIMITGSWSIKVLKDWVYYALDHLSEFESYRTSLSE
jgi:hypothetical protein